MYNTVMVWSGPTRRNARYLRALNGRATVLTISLLALSVLAGSQSILSLKARGLRVHPTRRLRAPKDLETASVVRSASRSRAALAASRSRDQRIPAPEAASRFSSRSGTLLPDAACVSLFEPAYLHHSRDPNTHSGPPV
jgi:hypothetical protein